MVLIRTTAAIELVHAFVAVIYTAIRFSFLIDATQGSAWLTRVEFSTWLAPVETAAIGALLLMASKPITRFASSFAKHSDAASQFE